MFPDSNMGVYHDCSFLSIPAAGIERNVRVEGQYIFHLCVLSDFALVCAGFFILMEEFVVGLKTQCAFTRRGATFLPLEALLDGLKT